MFCDLRGFTSFTETAEPEELFEVLQEYHSALGELIRHYQGTLEHFAGDGLMVFFNDPLPVEEHELKAVELALAAHERFEGPAAFWRKRGHELGLGVGSPPATPPSAASASRAGTTTEFSDRSPMSPHDCRRRPSRGRP